MTSNQSPNIVLDSPPFRERSFSDSFRTLTNNDNVERAIDSYNYDPNADLHFIELSRKLAALTSQFDDRSYSRSTKELLSHISPKYVEKYEFLLGLVAEWRPKREALIKELETFADKMDKYLKFTTAMRFFSSTVDVTGSVGGLMLQSESKWAGYAFTAASICGFCSLTSTVSELVVSKRILDEVKEKIEQDHWQLEKIIKWFGETEELDNVVQDLFPHGINKRIIAQIQEASEQQDDYLKVFKAALVSNVKKDSNLLQNKDFLHTLQLFATSNVAPMWWNGIIYRKHPIMLDIGRMNLQIEFGQVESKKKSIIYQCIPALPLEQQRLASLPVAGRIMLNFLSIYDSLTDLRKGAKSLYSDKLRKQKKEMQNELNVVLKAVEMMKPQNNNHRL